MTHLGSSNGPFWRKMSKIADFRPLWTRQPQSTERRGKVRASRSGRGKGKAREEGRGEGDTPSDSPVVSTSKLVQTTGREEDSLCLSIAPFTVLTWGCSRGSPPRPVTWHFPPSCLGPPGVRVPKVPDSCSFWTKPVPESCSNLAGFPRRKSPKFRL